VTPFVRRTLLAGAVLLAFAQAAHANWTASGTFSYRDREFDQTGFTGATPTRPIRLADVEVVENDPTFLEVRWRSETSRFELRNGFLGIDRLASDRPTMLLGEIGPDLRALVEVFLDRPELRAKLAVCDLELLERLGTVRSSAFVYFEWFLRDAYGVKLLPAPAFTQGLIDRGLLSLGMG